MRIAILNDYKDEIIREISKNDNLILRVKVFKSINTLANEIKKFDVIITDVIHNEENIVDLVKKNILDSTYVIFVTEHEEMMKECFGMNIISFLLPIEIEEISQLLNRLDKRISKEILIDNQEELKWIHLNEVIYIEYNLRDLYFYLKNGNIEKKINANLSDIIKELNSYYIMINRSQIINLSFVTKIENEYVELHNQYKLKISVRRKKELSQKFKAMKG